MDNTSNPILYPVSPSDLIANPQTEALMKVVVTDPSPASTSSFFESVVCNLATALNVRYALVGEVVEPECDQIKVLALWLGQEWSQPFQYALAGTPCANVLNQHLCFYPQQVQHLFPKDSLLAEMSVESYVGIPIFDTKGKVIGLLAAMHDSPMHDFPSLRAFLTIFAARAGTVLERLQANLLPPSEPSQPNPQPTLLSALSEVSEPISDMAYPLDGNSTELELQQQSQVLKLILDHIPEQIFWKDVHSVYVGANQSWLNRLGLSHLSEVVGKTDYDLSFPEAIAEYYQQQDQRIIASGEPELDTVEHYSQLNGRETWINVNKVPIPGRDGQIIGVLGTISDITAYKQTEAALRETEARNRALLDAIPDLMFRLNRQGVLLDINLKPDQDFRADSESLLGKNIGEFMPEAIALQVLQAVDRALASYDIQVFEYQRQVNHALRDYEARIVVSGENEVLAIVRDISDRKQAERTAQQQAERDRLLKDIALQIRHSLHLEEILNTTVAEIQKFLQADRVLLYRLDANHDGELMAAAVNPTYALDAALDLHQTWIRSAASALDNPLVQAEEMYTRGDTWVVHDVEKEGFLAEHLQLMARLEVKAKLVVPILQGNQLWGLMTVHQCGQSRQWQPFEVDLLEQLATQVAIAIQQAQLFNQVKQQAERERLLNQISQSISASLDPQHIFELIVKLTGELFGVDRVIIYTLSRGQIEVLQEWRSHLQIPPMIDFVAPLSQWSDLLNPDSPSHHYQIFHAPDYADFRAAPAHQQEIQQYQTRSVLAAPLRIGNRLFGGLALMMTSAARTFSEDEIQVLSRIANQTAIALYNAQSYEQLEQLIQDRTQELEQEKLISETASRAKSEFLAIMSHELRTPLNAVLGLSELLTKEIFGALNAKQREYISCIHSSGQHLLALISDILDLSKVEAGKEELTLASIDILDLCEGCLSIVQGKASEAGLVLTSQIDPLAQVCLADERRLRQMILNLLSNAIKFTPHGEVSLIVQKHSTGLTFTVQDTGIGIAPEHLPSLFQPFHQLDSQLDRRYEGTGLGLVLTRRLAQLHGGDITVTSQLGRGSRFTIDLPDLADQDAVQSPQALPFSARGSGDVSVSHDSSFNGVSHSGVAGADETIDSQLVPSTFGLTAAVSPRRASRILIVEDDLDSAKLLGDYLQVLGYQVLHWMPSQSLVETVRQFEPVLVLMEVELSELQTGFDLLQQLKRQPDVAEIPVVMMTATAVRGDRERCLAAGAVDYLSKPVGILQLETMLLRCL